MKLIRLISAASGVLFLLAPSVSLNAQEQQKTSGARYVEELTARLSQLVRNVQDENAQLELQIGELNRKITQLQKEKEAAETEVRQLKRQLSQETATRESQIKDILKQIRILADTPVTVPVPQTQAQAQIQPEKTKQEAAPVFEEYTVIPGATLTVIAEAYKVSVQDIMKANGMKNDRLRAGQKLKIPVK